MIGGRVLDPSAVRAFADQRSVYASALVWTATEEDIVLLVPASVVSEVRAGIDDAARDVLEVLLGLPVAVVDPLDEDRAVRAADLIEIVGDLSSAHAAVCALDRGWPLVTEVPARYEAVAGLVVEELP